MVLLLGKRQVKNKDARVDSIHLRSLNHKDKPQVCRWMISPFIIHHTFVVPGPYAIPYDFATYAYAERYFYQLMTDKQRETFAIMYGDEHIGNVGLKEIDHKLLKAECFIEIGRSTFRGQGYGLEAMTQLLIKAFRDLGLKEVELEVLEFNVAAIKVYKRLGFRADSHYIWHYDEFGMYWRVIKMSLSASGFFARSLKSF